MGFYVQDEYWEGASDLPIAAQNEYFGSLVRLYFTGDTDEPKNKDAKRCFVFSKSRVLAARTKAEQMRNKRGTKEATNDSVPLIKSERESKSKRKSAKPIGSRFAAPSQSEFTEYAVSKGMTAAKAEELFCYYASQNWKKANGQKLSSWQLAVTGAIARDRSSKPKEEVDDEYSVAF